MEIVEITFQEAALLSNFAKETFYQAFVHTCSKEDMEGFLLATYDVSVLELELLDSSNHYYFAKEKDEIVGYVLFKANELPFEWPRKIKSLELQRIYVSAKIQSKGVGRQLADLVIDYGRHNGYDCVFLGVWEHNLRGQKFYQSLGFTLTGFTHVFPIGNTPQVDVWMMKDIKKSSD